MASHGKNYRARAEKVKEGARYEVGDGVKLLKQLHFAKFNETVDLQVRLGVDPRNSEQQVRGTVVLPHGTGKTVRVRGRGIPRTSGDPGALLVTFDVVVPHELDDDAKAAVETLAAALPTNPREHLGV